MILSCNTGEGHNSCAAALMESFQDRGCQCEIADALSFISKGMSSLISKGHVFIYRHMPWLFKTGYNYSENHEELFREDSPAGRLMASGADALYAYIQEKGFDTLICPHTFSAMMLTAMEKKYGKCVLSAFVDTDHTFYPGLAECRVDRYFMSDEEVIRGHEGQIPREKMLASGIPVRKAFYTSLPKAEAKARLGLPENAPHLLVMSGSMGCGPMRRLCAHLAKILPDDARMTVICGTNKRLRLGLGLMLLAKKNVCVRGYTRDMSLMLDSADLYLTKPGGISTSEAAVKALPMLLVNAVSGCEKYNSRFMTQSGLAETAQGIEALAERAVELLSDAERLREMSEAGRNIPGLKAAETVCSSMENILENSKEGI